MIPAIRRALWWFGAPVRALLLMLVRLYQLTLTGFLGGQCRFHPSCSSYAAQAIRARGAVVGVGLSVWRVLRCSPFSRGGLDPAPARRARPKYDSVTLQRSGSA